MMAKNLVFIISDEHQARAPFLDCFPKFAQLGDRLAAKRSTEMPQKHQ